MIVNTSAIGTNKNGDALFAHIPLLQNFQFKNPQTIVATLTVPSLPAHEVFTLDCFQEDILIGSCELPLGASTRVV